MSLKNSPFLPESRLPERPAVTNKETKFNFNLTQMGQEFKHSLFTAIPGGLIITFKSKKEN